MNITFVTGNKNKFEEAREIIANLEQQNTDLIEIQSIDPKEIIIHKLHEARRIFDGFLVVEDTSLCITALNGLPGPLIKWFQKTIGNEGLYKLASSFQNFEATASVILGFMDPAGNTQFFEGTVEGKIVEPRGELGFGWDPVFQPHGFDKTFAEMTLEEKSRVSMRKIAFQRLKNYLDQHDS